LKGSLAFGIPGSQTIYFDLRDKAK